MNSFELRLDRILNEMPLRHYVAGDRDAQGEPWQYRFADNAWNTGTPTDKDYDYFVHDPDRNSITEPSGRKFTAWSSPKFLKILSQKLSRLTSHNILLFVGGNIKGREAYSDDAPERNDPSRQQFLRQIAHKHTGIDPTILDHSIIVNITNYGGGQDTASPWIILHQVSEALMLYNENGPDFVAKLLKAERKTDIWDTCYFHLLYKYTKGTKIGMPLSRSLETYASIFKFKSAASRGVDADQEILTEYMWHGGNIRVNYPPDIPKMVIDRLKAVLERTCKKILDDAVGHVLSNNRTDGNG